MLDAQICLARCYVVMQAPKYPNYLTYQVSCFVFVLLLLSHRPPPSSRSAVSVSRSLPSARVCGRWLTSGEVYWRFLPDLFCLSVLGECGVGKTTLITRMNHGFFDEV